MKSALSIFYVGLTIFVTVSDSLCARKVLGDSLNNYATDIFNNRYLKGAIQRARKDRRKLPTVFILLACLTLKEKVGQYLESCKIDANSGDNEIVPAPDYLLP